MAGKKMSVKILSEELIYIIKVQVKEIATLKVLIEISNNEVKWWYNLEKIGRNYYYTNDFNEACKSGLY